jgi:hypothetical protein
MALAVAWPSARRGGARSPAQALLRPTNGGLLVQVLVLLLSRRLPILRAGLPPPRLLWLLLLLPLRLQLQFRGSRGVDGHATTLRRRRLRRSEHFAPRLARAGSSRCLG